MSFSGPPNDPGLPSGGAISGTAAARPAAGTANRLYWATDTNEISFDDGAAWHSLGRTSVTSFRIGNAFYESNVNTFRIQDTQAGIEVTGVGLAGIQVRGLDVTTVGNGLSVAEGANAKQGLSAAMVAGTVTVANTAVTANSRIQVTRQDGGTNPGAVYVSARVAGTSFTITSTNAADTGQVAYEIFEPG